MRLESLSAYLGKHADLPAGRFLGVLMPDIHKHGICKALLRDVADTGRMAQERRLGDLR